MHFRKIAPDIFQSKNFQTASILGKSNGPSGSRERGSATIFDKFKNFNFNRLSKLLLVSQVKKIVFFAFAVVVILPLVVVLLLLSS